MRHIRRNLLLTSALVAVCAAPLRAPAATSEAEYHAVVKLVESYFHVKHRGVPLVATAGLKAAKIFSSDVRRVMRFGDFKLAIFEDQNFGARNGTTEFHRLLRQTLQPAAWESLVAVRDRAEGLTYTYVKSDGDKFKVLIIALAQRDGTVLQVDLNREEFVKLLQDPEQESRNITDEATSAAKDDQE
jgi:hypothetical protein